MDFLQESESLVISLSRWFTNNYIFHFGWERLSREFFLIPCLGRMEIEQS